MTATATIDEVVRSGPPVILSQRLPVTGSRWESRSPRRVPRRSSCDDVPGSLTVNEDERGMGPRSKLAHSEDEHSSYYVNHHVD
ncbi:hypothetical protein WKI71_39830 [Streptomyces sp. MS1.AVA.1]|uniref:Uncharacterized protein n=1 Tax=Streptomyces machairae TaxID=3134109 RepID=A0ABU8UTP0_9ACTN